MPKRYLCVEQDIRSFFPWLSPAFIAVSVTATGLNILMVSLTASLRACLYRPPCKHSPPDSLARVKLSLTLSSPGLHPPSTSFLLSLHCTHVLQCSPYPYCHPLRALSCNLAHLFCPSWRGHCLASRLRFPHSQNGTTPRGGMTSNLLARGTHSGPMVIVITVIQML